MRTFTIRKSYSCPGCYGRGYMRHYDWDDPTMPEEGFVEDCRYCHGDGYQVRNVRFQPGDDDYEAVAQIFRANYHGTENLFTIDPEEQEHDNR